MRKILLKAASGGSEILVGAALEKLAELAPPEKSLLVADKNVLDAHAGRFDGFRRVVLEGGEGIKGLAALDTLYREFLAARLDRSSYVVGVGGGTISDLAGFAAATFLRGVRFGVVSTTLVGQLDAAIGGKNGINFDSYKNIVGTIRQPEFIIADPIFLESLPDLCLKDGFAEAIKIAAIEDASLFEFMEENSAAALQKAPGAIEEIVFHAASLKAAIVGRDERENGERVKLNFGHTLGHALESAFKLSHGQAVSIGMRADIAIAERRAMLSREKGARICALLERYHLPTRMPGKIEDVAALVTKDKKRFGGSLKLALPTDIGASQVVEVPVQEFAEAVNDLP